MRTTNMITCLILIITCVSCDSEEYRFTTHINRDGSCIREIVTPNADSAFLAGDMSHNPFPYELTPDWKMEVKDTININSKQKTNVKISKKFNSVDELSTGLRTDKFILHPKETLKKQFRWFYTYYTFNAVYPEVAYKGNIPMDEYLNETEQKFIFQGDMSGYKGMSGWELKDKLDDIGNKYLEWYNRTMYNEYFEAITYYAGLTGNKYHSQLSDIKDTLFTINEKLILKLELSDMDRSICDMLDDYFSIEMFSYLYHDKGGDIGDMVGNKINFQQYTIEIQYELSMPGKILFTNTELRENNLLSWKVDAYRTLVGDYTLVAESRAVNIWAFIVVLLLITFTIFCFRVRFR